MKNRSTNIFKVKKEDCKEAFLNKIANMLKNHGSQVREAKIVFQCEWENLKASDAQVKTFMDHIYRFPPLRRLNPRDAGKSSR